uniref:Uncharacterized protein n=1 Tax=Arundo donax TaxID=35708 RepID=A0A0A9FWU6_ARUDO
MHMDNLSCSSPKGFNLCSVAISYYYDR